jgi:hypothetical protein
LNRAINESGRHAINNNPYKRQPESVGGITVAGFAIGVDFAVLGRVFSYASPPVDDNHLKATLFIKCV